MKRIAFQEEWRSSYGPYYAGSVLDRKSTSRYYMILGGNLVIWRSKKHNVVARFSAEDEFRAMKPGVCELLWMEIVLDDLRIKYDNAIRLFCDNKSTVSIAHNLVQHDRTKHEEIDQHFIKGKLENGLINTACVLLKHQMVDVLTK